MYVEFVVLRWYIVVVVVVVKGWGNVFVGLWAFEALVPSGGNASF